MAQFVYTWENLRFSVREKVDSSIWGDKKEKVILDGVSGSAFSGSVNAIMGLSGCGKSTLLSILSGQRRGKGVLRINGRPINGKMLRSNSTFVQQKDTFIETLTVYEHLTFMAAMCLKKKFKDRVTTVKRIIKDVNLEKAQFTNIEYLSSGEKRKLSLASNLLLEPYILFCDEPTTGLDSYSAISIVQLLETIAATGKIVFLSVHQPSSQLFELFDNLILLSSTGKLVFQGTRENAQRFFERQFLFCPESYNPAEYYVKKLAVQSTVDENRLHGMVKVYNEEYAVKFNFSDIEYHGLLLRNRNLDKNFFYTMYWLSWRIFKNIARRLQQHWASFLLTMATALLIAITYTKATVTGTESVQNIQGVLLLMISELIFGGMYRVIDVFPAELEVFTQEKHLYESFPYFLSKLLSVIPFGVIHCLGYLLIYFMCLQFLITWQLFLQMYVIILGAALGGNALGLCLSALFPTIDCIHLFIVPLELLCLLLSGLWIKINTLPKFFGIVKYFSPFYVSFESLSIVYWMKIDKIDLCSNTGDVPCYTNGTQVLESYDFIPNYDKVLNNFMYLLILIALYCYIGYISILRKRALYQI